VPKVEGPDPKPPKAPAGVVEVPKLGLENAEDPPKASLPNAGVVKEGVANDWDDPNVVVVEGALKLKEGPDVDEPNVVEEVNEEPNVVATPKPGAEDVNEEVEGLVKEVDPNVAAGVVPKEKEGAVKVADGISEFPKEIGEGVSNVREVEGVKSEDVSVLAGAVKNEVSVFVAADSVDLVEKRLLVLVVPVVGLKENAGVLEASVDERALNPKPAVDVLVENPVNKGLSIGLPLSSPGGRLNENSLGAELSKLKPPEAGVGAASSGFSSSLQSE
jgi:hypothetical protein